MKSEPTNALDIDAFFMDSFPVVVSADADLEEGQNKQLDTQALGHYFDAPMVIDEIRVQIASPLIELDVGNFGGSIRLKLSLGPYALSRVFIPVGCLGPTFDGGTLGVARYEAGVYSPEGYQTITAIPGNLGFFRWKLPRPLVCPVGMPLNAQISRQVEGLNQIYSGEGETTVSVNVAYAGRVTKKPLPSGIAIPIPYVGLFANVFTSASVATSNQLDLYNPFQTTLYVHRLMGRWQNIYLDQNDPGSSLISLDANGPLGQAAIDFPLTQIQTFSGFSVTNKFIPGGTIWEANTRSMTSNVTLESGEGFEVMIDATAGVPSTGAQPSPNGSNISLVTMIGWRMENI